MLRRGGGVAVAAGIAVLCALAGAPSATADHARGVHPKPRFATTSRAAYCTVEAVNQNDLGAELLCWRPRDGLAVWLGWKVRRATTAFVTRPPRVVHGLTVLKGYRPRSPVVGFGQVRQVRCGDPARFSTCSGRAGVVAFRCTSRSRGLTCVNATRHGFSLGRVRGLRLF